MPGMIFLEPDNYRLLGHRYFFASAAFLPAQYFFIRTLTAFFWASDMVERFFLRRVADIQAVVAADYIRNLREET
jgi:hypothetical protein